MWAVGATVRLNYFSDEIVTSMSTNFSLSRRDKKLELKGQSLEFGGICWQEIDREEKALFPSFFFWNH